MNDAGKEAPLGILGGTFDPVHFAHLRLAEEARDRLNLDRVRLIPAGTPPHRQPPLAGPAHRLAMARLAVEDNPGLELDEGEIHASGPSYTVLTLERLRRELGPRKPLVLLLGADAFLGLSTWHRWQELFDLAHLAVATRPAHVLEAAHMAPALAAEFTRRQVRAAQSLRESLAGCILPFGITSLDISATGIRAALQAGGSPRYLLPNGVLDYIHRHHLYSNPHNNAP